MNLRRADIGPGITAEGDQVVDIADQLETMSTMRDEGKIGAIGLSGVTLERLRAALPAGIACVQNAYGVLHRANEALVGLCLTRESRGPRSSPRRGLPRPPQGRR